MFVIGHIDLVYIPAMQTPRETAGARLFYVAWVLTERWEIEFVACICMLFIACLWEQRDGDRRLLLLIVLSGAVGWTQENPLDMLSH